MTTKSLIIMTIRIQKFQVLLIINFKDDEYELN